MFHEGLTPTVSKNKNIIKSFDNIGNLHFIVFHNGKKTTVDKYKNGFDISLSIRNCQSYQMNLWDKESSKLDHYISMVDTVSNKVDFYKNMVHTTLSQLIFPYGATNIKYTGNGYFYNSSNIVQFNEWTYDFEEYRSTYFKEGVAAKGSSPESVSYPDYIITKKPKVFDTNYSFTIDGVNVSGKITVNKNNYENYKKTVEGVIDKDETKIVIAKQEQETGGSGESSYCKYSIIQVTKSLSSLF